MSDDFLKIVQNVQTTGSASRDGKTPRVVHERFEAQQRKDVACFRARSIGKETAYKDQKQSVVKEPVRPAKQKTGSQRPAGPTDKDPPKKK